MPESLARLLEEMQDVLPDLTPKQTDCLKFLVQYFLENQNYPTRDQIAARLGVSRAHVNRHVTALEKKKYLRRIQGAHSRNIRITEDGIRKLSRTDPAVFGQQALFTQQVSGKHEQKEQT